jgi:hypothetical protein
MRHEKSGVTGKILEQELFGASRYQEMTGEHSPDFEYRELEQGFRVLKTMQPFDSTDPAPDFANAVHAYIFDRLGLDAEKVHFYTAVESSLDRYQGIDGWFEITTNGEDLRVTIDITQNPNKESYKANIVFLVPNGGLDRKVDKEQFKEYTNNLANEVIEIFKRQGLGVSPERIQ